MRILKSLLAVLFITGIFSVGVYYYSKNQIKKYAVKLPTEGEGLHLRKFTAPEVDATPILMYHHIRANPDPNNKLEASLDVLPKNFEKQISYLAKNKYQTERLTDLFSSQDKSTGPRVIITFDDGYKDVITEAYPILKRYGYTATVFPIVDYVGRDFYLTWSDLWILKTAGWEIGSHTLTHADLTKIPYTQAKEEMNQSKKILEYQMKSSIEVLSYPAGRYNSDIIGLAKEAGYRRAVTTVYGKLNYSDEDLGLKRIRISGSDQLPNFINKLK